MLMDTVIKKNVFVKYAKIDNGQLHWITISLRLSISCLSVYYDLLFLFCLLSPDAAY